VVVGHDGERPDLVLDAGTGLRRASSIVASPCRGTVLLTHLHYDHICGLPFFAAADRSGACTTLRVPAGSDHDARTSIDGVLAPPQFPVKLVELNGTWAVAAIDAGHHDVDGWTVEARWLPHGRGRSLGYRVSDGVTSFAYVTDHGPDAIDDHHDAVRALVEGADLVIHDAQHTVAEWPGVRHHGHAPIEYALGLARTCGVRRLLLSHHAPSRTDADLDALAATLPPWASFARQGEVIDLRPIGSNVG
jgi:ribonuclease BN (tRNA processing enzyme)